MTTPTADILIFDVDGVLIDTRDSFLYVTAETVKWCWENIFGGDADSEGYTPGYFRVTKTHSSFNDDVNVSWAILRMMEIHKEETGSKSMREVFPSLEKWVSERSKYDGVDVPELAARTPDSKLPLPEMRKIFEEIYYGQTDYEAFKGKAAYGIQGKGFWQMELPGTAKNWNDFTLPVGIYTGRTAEEMVLAKKILAWDNFPPDMLIDASEGIHKPSPLGLQYLCERTGSSNPLFFGDTASDKQAWLNFGKGAFVAIGNILKDEPLQFDTLQEALDTLL